MNHPKKFIRDTQKYQGYRDMVGGKRKPGLKLLAKRVLKLDIQSGEHSSVSGTFHSQQLFKKKRRFEDDCPLNKMAYITSTGCMT